MYLAIQYFTDNRYQKQLSDPNQRFFNFTEYDDLLPGRTYNVTVAGIYSGSNETGPINAIPLEYKDLQVVFGVSVYATIASVVLTIALGYVMAFILVPKLKSMKDIEVQMPMSLDLRLSGRLRAMDHIVNLESSNAMQETSLKNEIEMDVLGKSVESVFQIPEDDVLDTITIAPNNEEVTQEPESNLPPSCISIEGDCAPRVTITICLCLILLFYHIPHSDCGISVIVKVHQCPSHSTTRQRRWLRDFANC